MDTSIKTTIEKGRCADQLIMFFILTLWLFLKLDLIGEGASLGKRLQIIH